MVSVKEIIENAATILLDENGLRWPVAELVRWYNAGQRDAVTLKPDVNPVDYLIKLSPGPRQELPAGAYMLLQARCNRGADGSYGPAVLPIGRDILDILYPGWAGAESHVNVKFYMLDQRNQRVFYVYPPQPWDRPGQIDTVVSMFPAEVVLANGKIPDSAKIDIGDELANAMVDYILYRAFSKDGAGANATGRAASHLAAFRQALGLTGQVEEGMGDDVEFYKQRSRERRAAKAEAGR